MNYRIRIVAVLMAWSVVLPSLHVHVVAAQTSLDNAGLPDTHMGAYRTLADSTIQAFRQGDIKGAAKFARILERTWDKGEGPQGGENSVWNLDEASYNDIDGAMDKFIDPLIFKNLQPDRVLDPDKVSETYESYVHKLERADGLIYRFNGVPQTKLGGFSALGKIIYDQFKKGDISNAQTTMSILRSVWYHAEYTGCTDCFSKTNPTAFKSIDTAIRALNAFVYVDYRTSSDLVPLQKVYNDYMEALKLADKPLD